MCFVDADAFALALDRDFAGAATVVSVTDDFVFLGEMGAGFLALLVLACFAAFAVGLLTTGVVLFALLTGAFLATAAVFGAFATAGFVLAFAVTAFFATALDLTTAAAFFATGLLAVGRGLAFAFAAGALTTAFALDFAAGFARARRARPVRLRQTSLCHQPYHHRVATDSFPAHILQTVHQSAARGSMSFPSELLGLRSRGRRPIRQRQGQLAGRKPAIAMPALVRGWLRSGADEFQLASLPA